MSKIPFQGCLKIKKYTGLFVASAIVATSVLVVNPLQLGSTSGVAMAQLDSQTGPTQSAATITANWTGTIITFPIVSQALLSQVQVDLLTATQTAIDAVGENSTAVESSLRVEGGYLVYVVSAIDSNQRLHRVIVDPGTGDILVNLERPSARFETSVTEPSTDTPLSFPGPSTVEDNTASMSNQSSSSEP